MAKKKIKLGDKIRDKITGFEGVAIAYAEWMNGCNRWASQPTELSDKGKPREAEWFDEQQVELAKAEAAPKRKPSGGPMPDPSY